MIGGFDENEQFVRQFIIETEEHIDSIETNLLELEKNLKSSESFNQESINELFRAIHTIKGLSGMLEFNQLLNFTHLWENLLDNVRKRKQELNSQIINVSFDGLDLLTKILDEIKRTKTDQDISVDEIITKLDNIITGDKAKENVLSVDDYLQKLSPLFQKNLLDFEKNKLVHEIELKHNIYEIRLFLNNDCFEKNISYLSTCINLEFLGEIINISCNVNQVPSLEHFEPQMFDLEIFILLSTEENEERIYNIIKNREIRVNKINFYATKEKELIPTKAIIETKPEDIIQDKLKTEKDIDSIEKDISNKIRQSKLASQDTIRVETTRLDTLLALLGEQVISKTQLEHLSGELSDLLQNRENADIDKKKLELIADNFTETMSTFSRLNNELQETVMRIRMLPIGNVFNRFNRVVRDLSRDLGKKIDLIIEGEDTELDKTIIEEISDPLIHLIRNAIDHGIELPEERKSKGKPETGILHFNAYQQGNSIVITIKDDGRGLNIAQIKAKALEKGVITSDMQLTENEIINLIFEAGFTTSQNVTEISGRGVGMDVVRQNIANLKGTIDIETKENKGTTFIIKLPLTLAIIQALLVKINNHTFAIPLSSVVESYRARSEEIKLVNNKPVLKLRDRIIPIMYFQDYFKLDQSYNSEKAFHYVVVIGVAETKIGFIVDGLVGQQEIVIKPLNDPLVRIKGIAGATLLGNGVTLIIDAISIVLSNYSKNRFDKAGVS